MKLAISLIAAASTCTQLIQAAPVPGCMSLGCTGVPTGSDVMKALPEIEAIYRMQHPEAKTLPLPMLQLEKQAHTDHKTPSLKSNGEYSLSKRTTGKPDDVPASLWAAWKAKAKEDDRRPLTEGELDKRNEAEDKAHVELLEVKPNLTRTISHGKESDA